jgi:hypothetical protein
MTRCTKKCFNISVYALCVCVCVCVCVVLVSRKHNQVPFHIFRVLVITEANISLNMDTFIVGEVKLVTSAPPELKLANICESKRASAIFLLHNTFTQTIFNTISHLHISLSDARLRNKNCCISRLFVCPLWPSTLHKSNKVTFSRKTTE